MFDGQRSALVFVANAMNHDRFVKESHITSHSRKSGRREFAFLGTWTGLSSSR